MLLAVIRDVGECSMLLSGACVSAAAELRDVRECFMLLSGVCVSAAGVRECSIGLATEFCSEKVSRNRFGLDLLFRGRKCSFRGIPSFTEESIPRLGTEENGMKKISFIKKSCLIKKNRSEILSSSLIFYCILHKLYINNQIHEQA